MEKHSKDFQIFSDIWELLKSNYVPRPEEHNPQNSSPDKYDEKFWEKLVANGNAIVKKYNNDDLASKLVTDLIGALDKRFKVMIGEEQ